MNQKIFIFLFEGFSDWELAYLTPEINKSKDSNNHSSNSHDLIYFSIDGDAVQSLGGMHVVPDMSLEEIATEDIRLLVLPGGSAWEKGENQELNSLVQTLYAKQAPIAAICAATVYLGQLGILDKSPHTSNDLNYLKALAPQYQGESFYRQDPAIHGQNLITASGIAPIEFAQKVFEELELYPPAKIEKWYQLFKHGVWSE